MATAEQLARLHAAVPAAQASWLKWRVPASVTLAQWIPESSWGASRLAVKYNNYFGIKATHEASPSTYVEMPTAEYERGLRTLVDALFERYPNVQASFDAHARLLALSARYKFTMTAAASTPPDVDAFAMRLEKAGYSTSPGYAVSLIRAMHDYNLYAYDILPAGPAGTAAVAA